ncbi:hypothetical protein COP1_011267 [Malus domestica]
MANAQILFFPLAFSLLYISRAEAREIPAASTLPVSGPNESLSSSAAASPSYMAIRSSSLEEGSLDGEADCKGLNSEECLMRRSMVAHTDYIYTQDISPTGP